MPTIDTDNPYDDFPANLHAVLDTSASKTAIGHTVTYATIEGVLPSFPAICIEFDNAQYDYDDPISDQKVYCNIFYVHSLPGEDVRQDDIRTALGAIFNVLHDDENCNGYATTRLLEADVEMGSLILGRDQFADQPGFAGGRIQVMYGKKWQH